MSALAVAGAIAAFTRADHDNQVAKVAGLAIADDAQPRKKAQVCTKAIADWNGARGDASEALRELLVKQKDPNVNGSANPGAGTPPPPPSATAPVSPPPSATAPVHPVPP